VSEQNKIRLTPKQAAAFTMARQLLTGPAGQPLDVVRRLTAVQAQYSATVPLALWARTASLSLDWVKSALLDTKVLVKTWCLRGTVHVLASADLAMMVGAIGSQQLRDHERFMKTRRGMDGHTIDALNEAVLGALAQRPLGRLELHLAVPELANIEGASWGLDVKALAFLGGLVFADVAGAETHFERRDAWLPGLSWVLPSEIEAQRELLLRYLLAYGPATMQDFAHWSGLKMKAVRETLEACAPDLIPVEVAAWHGDYYLCAKDESVLTDRDEPQGVRFLPKFDPLLMAYKDKQRFIGEHFLSQVYRRGGQVEAVVLLAGQAIATWRTRLQGTRLRFVCRSFGQLGDHERSMLTYGAEQLAAFLCAKKLDLVIQASEE
jgi:hypothetical protein